MTRSKWWVVIHDDLTILLHLIKFNVQRQVWLVRSSTNLHRCNACQCATSRQNKNIFLCLLSKLFSFDTVFPVQKVNFTKNLFSFINDSLSRAFVHANTLSFLSNFKTQKRDNTRYNTIQKYSEQQKEQKYNHHYHYQQRQQTRWPEEEQTAPLIYVRRGTYLAH